jgi:N-(2-amino-2-carboxyethyl)-L-glutamate synthase
MHINVFEKSLFLPITDLVASSIIHLKIESLNMSGSIKQKTAEALISDAEKRGEIYPGGVIIESSSGNLGVALASICAKKKYKFICVVDPNASRQTVAQMKAFGANIIEVTKKDENGGYLGTRIEWIKHYVQENPSVYWTNQYKNPANAMAHELTTGPEIHKAFPEVELVVIGAGTTGTLMGCIRYFKKNRPQTKILAVDSVGSVTFGSVGKRFIPGIGTSRRPETYDPKEDHERVLVPEAQAIQVCRWLASNYGYLPGGSTGSVLAGLCARLDLVQPGTSIVAISPDSGEKYLETIYNDEWVNQKYQLSTEEMSYLPSP